MKKTITIYLAGSIQKGNGKSNDSYWTQENINNLRLSLNNYELIFLNPAVRSDDLSDQQSVFGRDMLLVYSSDFVFVDARNRRGLGVGAEMMWAKSNKIPVITWAPQNTHYHKTQTHVLGVLVEDFLHPFIYGLSDQVVETLDEGAEWIKRTITDPFSNKIKGVNDIHSFMDYYKKHQLHKEDELKEFLSGKEPPQ